MPRFWPFGRRKRALDVADLGARYEDRAESMSTPEARRLFRRDIDFVALYGSVYAAIRKRAGALAKPQMILVRQRGQDMIEQPNDHPALQALYEINAGLTHRQGLTLLGSHRLGVGEAFWVKRRNGLGVPVEFEIWPPDQVEVIPEPKTPWVPAGFKRHLANGGEERVALRDMIWSRHMIDPRNILRSLSPIGAIRFELDTGMEARRFNRAYFDNALMLGRMFELPDASPAEAQRVEQELAVKFRGTDNAHRAIVIAADDLKPIERMNTIISQKDMEFVAQLHWGVEEVARAFEVAPELLGSGSRTYENAPAAWRAFWEVVVEDYEAILEELNEFYIWPDFGREFSLRGVYDHIPALQEDQKLRAEIDQIHLASGRSYINEVRERDGQEPVPWGDVPLVPNTIAPLGSYVAPPVVPGRLERSLETDMRSAWQKRLTRERDAIIRHLEAADKRTISVSDVDSYDWDWERRYGREVAAELRIAFIAALEEAGFAGGPSSAQALASAYARERAGSLLSPRGKWSLPDYTKERVKALVVETLDKGQSLGWLEKQLREDGAFSRARAENVALTETRTAQGQASIEAYTSLGHEGKRWSTSGGVGDGPCDVCLANEAQGAIPLDEAFQSGDMTVPAHPHCYCDVDPVRELPRVMAGSNGHR